MPALKTLGSMSAMTGLTHKNFPSPHLQRKDMEDAGVALPKPLPTLYEIISSDEDAVLRTIMQITQGITSIVDKVQK